MQISSTKEIDIDPKGSEPTSDVLADYVEGLCGGCNLTGPECRRQTGRRSEDAVTAHIDDDFGFELDVEEIVAGRSWVNVLQ